MAEKLAVEVNVKNVMEQQQQYTDKLLYLLQDEALLTPFECISCDLTSLKFDLEFNHDYSVKTRPENLVDATPTAGTRWDLVSQ